MAPSGLGTGVLNLVEAIRKDSVQGQGIRAMHSVRLDAVPIVWSRSSGARVVHRGMIEAFLTNTCNLLPGATIIEVLG
jgi:hypothetical protein